MRVLLVKTSSLGDVIHNLPVVSDLHAHLPGIAIDWVVEQSLAEIPRLHPGVRNVIPVGLRAWRKQLLAGATWRQMKGFQRALRAETYDLVIDTQGLLKSALIAARARGPRCGYAADSAREPTASRLYDQRYSVARGLHAIERNRRLVAAAAGYEIGGEPDYGIRHVAVPPTLTFVPGASDRSPLAMPSAVLLTATSRDDKLWPEADWITLGTALCACGLHCLLPAGSGRERERAARIAAALPSATALPPHSLSELAGILASSRVTVGVDTGLAHLAVAVGCPTLALYRASDPSLTGVMAGSGGAPAINLGRHGMPPRAAEVVAQALEIAACPA